MIKYALIKEIDVKYI